MSDLARALSQICDESFLEDQDGSAEFGTRGILVPVCRELYELLAANESVESEEILEFIASAHSHIIITEDSDGNVDYSVYDSQDSAMVAWREFVQENRQNLEFVYQIPDDEYTVEFDYDGSTNSGVLVSSKGNTQFMQGDDASTLHDKLEYLATEDLVLLELSAYDTLWRDNG
jgi:hypothetical protein